MEREESPAGKLRRQRIDSLLEIYSTASRRLSPAEFDEIRPCLPPGEENKTEQPPPPPRVILTYGKRLADYSPIYRTQVRAIKGWIADGRAANIVAGLDRDDAEHLPPLDDPPRMSDWWTRHKSQRVPDKLLTFKLDAEKSAPGAPSAASPTGEPMDVSKLDLESEDEPLQQARRYLAATDKKLQAAYATGDENLIARWSRIRDKATDTYNAARRDAEAALKSRREFVSRSGVAADLSQLAEMWQRVRSTFERRIMSRVGEVPDEIATKIRDAIKIETEAETALIRRLPKIVGAQEFELSAP